MPDLRGELAANAPLAGSTWFRTGGPAQILFEPADEADLAYFLARLDPAIGVLTLGAASNLLVRDGGVEGVVIRLGQAFEAIAIDGLAIAGGAAARDMKLAFFAAKAGIAGLSFLRGIPGSIGGALRMNAGAYGAEIKDRLVSCRGVDRAGNIVHFANADMGFSYRHCGVDGRVIFTHAVFQGVAGDPER
ncbi:MAG: FAD-binding protein, partial [Roseiarcus sp.]